MDRRFLTVAALIAVLLTMLFGHWTDTSLWSFPWFLLAVWVLFYLPGTMLLPRDPGITLVERATLGLVLGMTASLSVYWALRLLNLSPLFWIWPLAALLTHVIGHSRRRLRIESASVGRHHWWLLALLIAELGVLAFLHGFYANLARHADGTMTLDTSSVDSLLHVSVAQELMHTVPPQVPFLAGQPLSYHYGMDLVAAMIAQLARLSVLDLTARFIPTLFVVMTTMAAYAFCARWLQSGSAGVFAALLIMVGEDLSFIPGLIVHPAGGVWSALFLGMPTALSLWFMNPMLPALAILFCGLLCLTQFQTAGRARWMYLAAFLFAILAEFKIFTALHGLLALGIAGLMLAMRSGERTILKAWLWSLLFVAPLLIYRWIVTRPDTLAEWRVSPWPYIPEMFKQFGWAGLFEVASRPFDGQPVTAQWVVVVVMIGLPLYLLLNLGVRGIGVPAIWRTLTRVQTHDPVRLVAAVFVVVGVFVSLLTRFTLRGAPLSVQYNNAVWFFVQSKQLVWPFALEALWHRRDGRAALPTTAVLVAVALLTMPSYVQFLGTLETIPPARIGRSQVALNDFLRGACTPGDVVFARQETAVSIVMLTPCRVPLAAVYELMRADQFAARNADQTLFWASWARGHTEWAVLDRYASRFLVVPTRPGNGVSVELGRRDGSGHLVARFTNDAFTVLEIAR